MQTPKRILIADDHSLVREGLRQLIESQDGLHVVGEATNGEEALNLIAIKQPDLLLLDLSMPNSGGIQIIEAALTLRPHLRILIVTAHGSSSFVYSALKAGGHGYLLKSEEGSEILRAINCILDGQSYLSPEVTSEVIRGYLYGGRQYDREEELAALTPRECELVDLILEGTTKNLALANSLFVSTKTIQKHKTNIFRKLDVSDTYELIKLLEKRQSNE
ncbi:response regulator transcription factor [Pseudodesulfovibrio sp. JC047]|uniref:response regulator transcription factor n=1 Tax=Pseudodesulfovibrio sp. JC047 TaxID=2683199 RepID=UPI0013CFF71D|nr:response regulator transcription factor [Pseudodesulfovibrio sp. JC047]